VKLRMTTMPEETRLMWEIVGVYPSPFPPKSIPTTRTHPGRSHQRGRNQSARNTFVQRSTDPTLKQLLHAAFAARRSVSGRLETPTVAEKGIAQLGENGGDGAPMRKQGSVCELARGEGERIGCLRI